MRRIALVLLAVAIGSVPAAAEAAGPKAARVEQPVRSKSPDKRVVRESYVRIHAPLPASAGPRPEACDWVTYLRFRHAKGPRRAWLSDGIVTAMPGIFAGASTFDQLARNTIKRAARKRRHIEVWALDRRSNCLEDHWGVQSAALARDERVAFDYYWGGREVRGRRFGGWASNDEARFLSDVGLQQTVRDLWSIIRRETPPRVRAKKVICGGHSLGGPLTSAFAGWDLDGNPETTSDAGYNQCAGFYGLDTSLTDGGDNDSGGLGPALTFAAAGEGSPYVNAPPLTPETQAILSPIGLAAYLRPDAESAIPELTPRNQNFETSQRLLFSRNAAEFATGMPSIRDFRITNAVALGAIFDDNSSPVSIFRTSLGTFDGGPVVEKDFPFPREGGPMSAGAAAAGPAGSLFAPGDLMAPGETHGPLYTWRSWDRMEGAPPQVDDRGVAYTSPAREVTDMHQFARTFWEAPANFSEWYFPTRLAAESSAATGGDRSGDLENWRYQGISKRPSLLIQAAAGIAGDDEPHAGPRGVGGTVVLPGYDHIDVATAAATQNGGHGERGSQHLAKFVLQVIGARR